MLSPSTHSATRDATSPAERTASGHRLIGEKAVVHLARRCPGSSGDPSLRANQSICHSPYEGQCEWIALLHDFTSPSVAVGQFNEPEFGRGEDHQILRQAIQINRCHHGNGRCFKGNVGLPHGVPGMPDRLAKTEAVG